MAANAVRTSVKTALFIGVGPCFATVEVGQFSSRNRLIVTVIAVLADSAVMAGACLMRNFGPALGKRFVAPAALGIKSIAFFYAAHGDIFGSQH